MVWSATTSSSPARALKSTSSRKRTLKASTVLAASYLRRLKRRSTTAWMRRRAGWNNAVTARVAPATAQRVGQPLHLLALDALSATPPNDQRPRGREDARDHHHEPDLENRLQHGTSTGKAKWILVAREVLEWARGQGRRDHGHDGGTDGGPDYRPPARRWQLAGGKQQHQECRAERHRGQPQQVGKQRRPGRTGQRSAGIATWNLPMMLSGRRETIRAPTAKLARMHNPLPAVWATNSSVSRHSCAGTRISPKASSPTVANSTARIICTWRVLVIVSPAAWGTLTTF
jgi:hypothetical protein